MRRYWFPKPYADTVAKLRVPSGFLLVAAFAYLASPSATSLALGVPVSVIGLLLRAWAAGHLAKNQNLAMSGPYSYMRNPLYVGTLLVAGGLVIASRQWILAALFGSVFLFVYLPVIELEEQHLRKLFPNYGDYAAKVPMLLPLGRLNATGTFQSALYLRNQEYQALIGYLAGLLLLILTRRAG
jgi:protein-S-isoprenylcysteine O-methyltransferase Ste14